MTDDEITSFLSMLDDPLDDNAPKDNPPKDESRWIARAALLQLQIARAQLRHYKLRPPEWQELPHRVVDFARKCERRVLVGHYAATAILDAHPRSDDQAFRDGFSVGYAVHRELLSVFHKFIPANWGK